jgi:hypothetical protein
MAHPRTVVIGQFLKDLARLRDEAKVLIDHRAKYLVEGRPTARPARGRQIYERYVTLRQLIFMQFPRLPQGEWKPPFTADSLFGTDLRKLRTNAGFLAAELSALLL